MVRQLFRAAALAIAVSFVGVGTAVGQEGPSERQEALKATVEQLFKVSSSRAGLVLVPRRELPGITTIEVADGSVSLDGLVVTGDELRRRLGTGADAVMQLSYLDAGTLRRLFPVGASAPPERPQREDEGRTQRPGTWDDEGRYRRQAGSRIRFGGSIDVPEDERVTEAVVAIGGSVTVNGRVDDDVVAIGGSVFLGPHSVVRGDVTSIGGHVTREEGAEVRGKINEVGIGRRWGHQGFAWPGIDWRVARWFAFAGTVTRVIFVLLIVALLAALAAGPVAVTGQRAADSPWLALLVGFGLQLLIGPALIAIVVALVISIVGIPLLVTIPLLLLGVIVLAFVGFAGVAARVGGLLTARFGRSRSVLATAVIGALAIAAVTLMARVIGLLPFPAGLAGGAVGVLGFAIEYFAWTIGIGAAVMALFEWQHRPPVPPVPSTAG